MVMFVMINDLKERCNCVCCIAFSNQQRCLVSITAGLVKSGDDQNGDGDQHSHASQKKRIVRSILMHVFFSMRFVHDLWMVFPEFCFGKNMVFSSPTKSNFSPIWALESQAVAAGDFALLRVVNEGSRVPVFLMLGKMHRRSARSFVHVVTKIDENCRFQRCQSCKLEWLMRLMTPRDSRWF